MSSAVTADDEQKSSSVSADSERGSARGAAEWDAKVDAVIGRVREQLGGRRLIEATYRLQIGQSFTFRDVAAQIGYLSELGISDCYLSPYVKARAGTTHGYDVVDHNAINPEIGTEAELAELAKSLKAHKMGHILDVVPNHMGIDTSENAWWIDVLENGPGSPYASFFDIDWMPLKPDLANKVLLPILGDQYGKVLEDQQLMLAFEDGAFFLRYYERRFPIAADSWELILRQGLEEISRRLGEDDPQSLEYRSILTAVSHLPRRTERDPEKVSERRREKEVIKRRLLELVAASPDVAAAITQTVQLFNGRKGDPRSFDLLDQLLLDQSYRLAFWRVAADEINYRRFFDINDMAAICMENPEVFQKSHGLILRLVDEEKIHGLRIDHPDGLYDPSEYLKRLQRSRFLQHCRRVAHAPTRTLASECDPGWDALESRLAARFDSLAVEEPGDALLRPLYVVVEKILEPGEQLPEAWPVFGTTGYDFLNAVNGLFVDQKNDKAFQSLYEKFIRHPLDFPEEVYRCKRLIMGASMSSEVNVLGHQLDRLSELNRRLRDFTLSSLTEALREVIASFPIYRTYVTPAGVSERDRRYIDQAVARAKRRNRTTSPSVFDFIRHVLLLDHLEGPDEATKAAHNAFVGKFQQVTSPVMAKAVEDTAFYRYNRLVSLNEVGGDPQRFGMNVPTFHQQNQRRQALWPHSMLATATHDTKRGEDVRARINVLSEIPKEYRSHLFRWARWNQGCKTPVEDEPAPSRNDEALLYQTLLGTWPLQPFEGDSRRKYVERIQEYMVKATREAKSRTSWVSPNESYERATCDFVEAVLRPSRRPPFLADFEPFARRIAELGMWNSLAQTLLKLTSPGVPDVYQGTEVWDFSLVDPDNRRPVDFQKRRDLLSSLREPVATAASADSRRPLAEQLVESRIDGRIKLYVIWRVLDLRRRYPGLFTTGSYLPLEATGPGNDHVCAFARQQGKTNVITIVPRLISGLLGSTANAAPIGAGVWQETRLELPSAGGGLRFRNLFTGELLADTQAASVQSIVASLPLRDVLASFPVAVLETVP